MRIIYNDKDMTYYDYKNPTGHPVGNGAYSLSGEIDKFIIPPKGAKMRSKYFSDDGTLNTINFLEEHGIEIEPEEIINDDRFWNNRGLFLLIKFKDDNWKNWGNDDNGKYDKMKHLVADFYRNNNGHYRLVNFERFTKVYDKVVDVEKNDFNDIVRELDPFGEVLSQKELEKIFVLTEYEFFSDDYNERKKGK